MTNMKRRLSRLLNALLTLASVFLFWTLGDGSLDAQTSQPQLAQQLREDGPPGRRAALEQARAILPENRSRELRDALIAALEREALFLKNRRLAIRKGAVAEELADPVFISNAAEVIAELHDARAIPALAAALGSGGPAIRALVEFGEQSVAPMVAIVRSPDASPESAQDGLLALRFLVEGEPPLSGGALQEVKRAAEERLTGRQFTAVLWRAIDLAIALKDARLRALVERLASDANEVRARSVPEIDSQLVQRTQQLAKSRLAGAAAIPDRVQWMRGAR
jgi:hypothetical protein